MKSGASESSYVFLQNYIKIPKHIHISHIPQDLYKSRKQVKILWAQHAYDQPHYINFNKNLIDLIVCPSEWAKKQFIKYLKVPENKLKVIKTGVNEIFTPSKNKTKTFIHTSIPYKGLELLPYIFPKVLEKHPDAKLKVFSSMGLYEIEEDPYKKIYDKLKLIPNVEYSPAVDQNELVKAYQEAAFFIHPNIWEETFCVSMVEGMSCGCYPIITDIGAIPEISKGIASIVPIEGTRTSSKYEVTETFINNFVEACINACNVFEKDRLYYDKISLKISNITKKCYDWGTISQEWKQLLEEYQMSEKFEELNIITSQEAIREDKDYLKQAFDNVLKWEESDKELAQGRTNFQLEKFFLLEQYTIPAAFQATIKNRRSMAEAYMQKLIEMKQKYREFEYKWKDKDKTQPIEWYATGPNSGGTKLCWYDLDKFEITNFLKSAELEIRDRIQQIQFFDRIIEKLIEKNGGKLVTKEQFEDEDHVYWERRFAEQAFDEIISKQSGISIGNLHSMRRGTAPTLVTGDQNIIKGGYPELGLALNPETSLQFLQELQQKIISGMEEITGEKSDILKEQSQQQLPQESFFNNDSGMQFYHEE